LLGLAGISAETISLTRYEKRYKSDCQRSSCNFDRHIVFFDLGSTYAWGFFEEP